MDMNTVGLVQGATSPQGLVYMAIGAGVGKGIEKAAIKLLTPLPALIVGRIKAAAQKAAASGRLDGATVRLLQALARAGFAWADEELPSVAGPQKMDALLDKAAKIPVLGILIAADRDGARALLEAEYQATKEEIKAVQAEIEAKEKLEHPAQPVPSPAPEAHVVAAAAAPIASDAPPAS